MRRLPAALDEAKGKDIEPTLGDIAAQVFDKCAVDKAQVVFHDSSFVEPTPRNERKIKLRMKIELTDFWVYYSQGAAEAVIAARKEGCCWSSRSSGPALHLRERMADLALGAREIWN